MSMARVERSGPSRWKAKNAVALFALLLPGAFATILTGRGQTAGVNQGGPEYLHAPAGMDPMPQHSTPEATAKIEQMRRAERHRQVIADAAKLVLLSNELKLEVDQMSPDQLPLGVVRKAGEIEKLAHHVKEGMKF